jgi:hypothetical protein
MREYRKQEPGSRDPCPPSYPICLVYLIFRPETPYLYSVHRTLQLFCRYHTGCNHDTRVSDCHLIAAAGPAFAGWVAVAKPPQPAGRETVYFDPETIQRNGTRATLRQLTDIKWNSTTRFLSSKIHKEFDCAGSRVRVLQVIEFSRQMGAGRSTSGYIENGNWQPVQAQNLNHVLWRAACSQH